MNRLHWFITAIKIENKSNWCWVDLKQLHQTLDLLDFSFYVVHIVLNKLLTNSYFFSKHELSSLLPWSKLLDPVKYALSWLKHLNGICVNLFQQLSRYLVGLLLDQVLFELPCMNLVLSDLVVDTHKQVTCVELELAPEQHLQSVL